MTLSLWKHNNLFKIFETWLLKLKNEFVGKLLCLNTWIFCSSLLHSTIWNCFLWRKIVLSFPKRMCIIRFLRLKSHLVVRISCAAEAHHTSHFPTSTDSLLSFWVPALCGNLKCWNHFVCGREDLRESNQLTLSCSVFFCMRVTLQISIHYHRGWRHCRALTHIMEFEGTRKTSWRSAPEPVQHVFVSNRHRLKRCLSVTLEKIMLLTGVPTVGNIITLLPRARIIRATVWAMLCYEYISHHFLHYPCVLSSVRHLYHAGASFSPPPWAAQPRVVWLY